MASHNAVAGTLAAWTLRYCPFVFCGSQREAADFSFRLLAAQGPNDNTHSSSAGRTTPAAFVGTPGPGTVSSGPRSPISAPPRAEVMP